MKTERSIGGVPRLADSATKQARPRSSLCGHSSALPVPVVTAGRQAGVPGSDNQQPILRKVVIAAAGIPL